MSYLFIKKPVSKRKVCIIVKKIKNLKNPKKTQKNKKTLLVGFLGGFFIANPNCNGQNLRCTAAAGRRIHDILSLLQ
jgi:hypothetical protein